MSEDLIIDATLSKQEKYEALLPQLAGLLEGETDVMANLGNIMAALKFGMNWFWVGVYFVKDNPNTNEKELVLSAFQGPIACTRIAYGRGVCGTAWKNKSVIIVDDVDQFPGHIACSSFSKSEIVLPAFKNGEVVLIMDIDSDQYATFDKTDETYLLKVMGMIENII